MTQRIVVMRDGVIQQIGTARDVYKAPANTFVARFIGSPGMNLLDFKHDGSTITIGGARAEVGEGCTLPTGDDFMLGCRPEDVSLDTSNKPGIRFPAIVTALQPLGASLLVDLQTAGGQVRLIVITAWREPMPEPGNLITLFAPADQLSIFDSDTGIRLFP